MRGYFKIKICYWAIGLFLGSFTIIHFSQNCVGLTEVSASAPQGSLSLMTLIKTTDVIPTKVASTQSRTDNDDIFNPKKRQSEIALSPTEWLSCAQVDQIFAETKTKNGSLYR